MATKPATPSDDNDPAPVDTEFADAHSLLFGEYMRTTEPTDRAISGFAEFLTSKKDG